MLDHTNQNQFIGSVSAIGAAFIWASYYSFIFFGREFSQILIFAIPALSGSAVFIIPLIWRRKPLSCLMDRKVFVTGALYFGLQFSIIVSASKNGAVATALFALFGDAILSPLLSILFRVNTVRLRYPIFALSLIITIPASSILILYGHDFPQLDLIGILWLIAVMILVPAAFIVLNIVIEEKGTSNALAGTFFWPGVVALAIGAAGIFPSVSIVQVTLGLGSLIFIGVTSMGVAYILFFESSRRTGFAIASVLQALIPVFTLVTVHFSENIPITGLVAIFLTLACFGASLSVYSVKGAPTGELPARRM